MWLDIASKYIAQAGLSEQVETRCCEAKETMQRLLETEAEQKLYCLIDQVKVKNAYTKINTKTIILSSHSV